MTILSCKNKAVATLALALSAAWLALAQGPPATVTLTGLQPARPQVNVSVRGTPGPATYCYFVVANYPGGSVVQGEFPACVNNGPSTLNGTNFVQVGWTSVTGVTNYDVIRFTTAGPFPSSGSCTSCSVATGTAATTFSDQGGGLGNYTLAGFPNPNPSTTLRLNNLNYSTPVVEFSNTYLFNPTGPLQSAQILTPTNPPTGFVKLYAKGGVWCSLSSAGVETCPVGGGGGGGGLTTVGDVTCIASAQVIDDCAVHAAVLLSSLATGTITVGNPAGTGDIIVGSSSATQKVRIADGTGAANVRVGENTLAAASSFQMYNTAQGSIDFRFGNTAQGGGTFSIFTSNTPAGQTESVTIEAGNAAATGIKTVSILGGVPGTAGNNRFITGGGTGTLATFNATTTTYQDWNFIATESGANNALVATLTDSAGNNITVATGLCFSVKLAHTLQAGANTLTLNGVAAAIKSHLNAANNIGTAYAATGFLRGCFDGTQYLDMSQ